jgi:hypothetical protein
MKPCYKYMKRIDIININFVNLENDLKYSQNQ